MGDEKADINDKSGGKKKTRISVGCNIGGLVVVGALVVVGLFSTFVVKRNKKRDSDGNPSLRTERSQERNDNWLKKTKEDRGSQGLRCLLQTSSRSNRGHGVCSTLTDIAHDERSATEIHEGIEVQEMVVPEREILICDDNCALQEEKYATESEIPIEGDEDKDVERIAENENDSFKDAASYSYMDSAEATWPVELIEVTMPELETCQLEKSGVNEATRKFEASVHTHLSSHDFIDHITENIMTRNERKEHYSTLHIWFLSTLMGAMFFLSLVSVSGKVVFLALFLSLIFKAVCKKLG